MENLVLQKIEKDFPNLYAMKGFQNVNYNFKEKKVKSLSDEIIAEINNITDEKYQILQKESVGYYNTLFSSGTDIRHSVITMLMYRGIRHYYQLIYLIENHFEDLVSLSGIGEKTIKSIINSCFTHVLSVYSNYFAKNEIDVEEVEANLPTVDEEVNVTVDNSDQEIEEEKPVLTDLEEEFKKKFEELHTEAEATSCVDHIKVTEKKGFSHWLRGLFRKN